MPKLLICCRSKSADQTSNSKKKKLMEAAKHAESNDVVVNPFLMRQETPRTLTLEKDGMGGIIDPKQLQKIEMPTPAMWQAIKSSYQRVMDINGDLRSQVREAKQEAAGTAAMPDIGRVKRRTQFTPAGLDLGASAAAGATGTGAAGSPAKPGRTPSAGPNGMAGFKSAAALRMARGGSRAKLASPSTGGTGSDSEGETRPKPTATTAGRVATPLRAASARGPVLKKAPTPIAARPAADDQDESLPVIGNPLLAAAAAAPAAAGDDSPVVVTEVVPIVTAADVDAVLDIAPAASATITNPLRAAAAADSSSDDEPGAHARAAVRPPPGKPAKPAARAAVPSDSDSSSSDDDDKPAAAPVRAVKPPPGKPMKAKPADE